MALLVQKYLLTRTKVQILTAAARTLVCSPPSKSESRGAGAEEAPVGKKDVVKKERKVFVVGGKGGGGDEGSRTAQQQVPLAAAAAAISAY